MPSRESVKNEDGNFVRFKVLTVESMKMETFNDKIM
jgi:hypothetical protein